MIKRIVPLVALTLAGCGGGSGGGTAVSVTPTPTPTATTTAYQTYAQLTGDQSFKTACAAQRSDYNPPLPVPTVAYGSGLTLSTTVATQTWTLTPDPRDTGLFGTAAKSYGPADRDATVTGAQSYARTTNGFQERFTVGSNSAGGASPDYVRGFFLRVPAFGATTPNPTVAQYQCVFGVPTRLDDLPTAALAYSRGGLNGTATVYPPSAGPESYAVTASTVTVSVDPAANRVTTTIHVVGQLLSAGGTASTTVDLGTYTGTGTIDRAAGSYGGTLGSSDRMIQNASFAGWFFGPQGAEAAFSLGFDSLDQISGRRLIFVGNALALR